MLVVQYTWDYYCIGYRPSSDIHYEVVFRHFGHISEHTHDLLWNPFKHFAKYTNRDGNFIAKESMLWNSHDIS